MNPLRPARLLMIVALGLVLAACGPDESSPTATPTPSPEPVATDTPSPEPTESPTEEASPSPSGDGDPTGFTVAPHPEADALFLDRDSCENPEDRYRLEFPDEWYTNTEIGGVPACSWFSAELYEVEDPAIVPDEIGVTIEIIEGDRGYLDEPISQEEVIVGATQFAVRTEVESDGVTMYEYVVQLGPTPEEGPNLLARTDDEMGGDYDLNKAVLDRIMATIEFFGTTD